MLANLGRTFHDRRRTVVAVWLFALLGIGAVTGSVGPGFSSEFTLPDVESARGFDILEDEFGGAGSGIAGTIVFFAEEGVEDPGVQPELEAFLGEVATIEGVRLVSPFAPEGANQIARDGERAGQIAYAQLEVPRDFSFEDSVEVGQEILELADDVDAAQIEVGGQNFAEFEPPESEILGLAFAIFILIISFGSVVAMGLPIGTAAAGIGVGIATVTLLSNAIEMPDFTATLGLMIGLGVGIDYALFIVTRYREELHDGHASSEAAGIAIDTAGRAVLFAGTTVVISLLGMLVMGVEFVRGLAIGASITVAVTMIASVTLLPALLGFVSTRIEVTRWRGLVAAALVALALIGVGLGVGVLLIALPAALVVLAVGGFVGPLRAEVPRRAAKPIEQTLPYRWSRLIARTPWTFAILGTLVLVILALPVLSLRIGFSDEGNFSEDTTTRKAYDLLAEGFGPGYNGPLLVAASLPPGTDLAVLDDVTAAVASTENVAAVSPAGINDPTSPTAAVWEVIPATSPQDAETTDLVKALRDEVFPAAVAGTGIEVAVTGVVAVNVDFSDLISARLPLFFAIVLLLSFLLLMAVFRSVLVPLKAVLMNLISIGAAYGIVVAVFQWGWGSSILGIEPAPVEPFLPMMLFAIVFGLSMDYEVFLLSRVKEEYDLDGDNGRAVADGLASTARVITAAAAIMVFIFSSFVLEDDRVIKLFGLGLASAIALDATIVRLLLVPATMELLGDRNWWIPAWLDRILPRINVEGGSTAAPPPAEEEREKVGAGV
ncbi:MAG: MMPL family transporter [Actinomycetota bacterium]